MPDKLRLEVERAKEEVLAAIVKLENLLAQAVVIQNKSIEGMRAQNSAEHGSLFSKLEFISITVAWLKKQWERFTHPGGH